MAAAPKPAYDFAALLATPIEWREAEDVDHPYEATLRESRLTLRLNDFPGEPLYTLMAANEEVGSFDDWPDAWKR